MKVLIVGLGLIGGSYAKGLTKKGYEVYGADIKNETIEYAIKNNYIIDGSTDASLYIPKVDLIILGMYPQAILPFLEAHKSFFNEKQVITDICGIKSSICEEATLLALPAKFVGSHPMAGREKVGIMFADEKIFKGKTNFLICPIAGTDEKAVKVVEEIAIALEFGSIHKISPKHHDEMIAYTSQLTHLIAVSLVNAEANDDVYKFIGDSYRDLTRIAMINEVLWSELFLDNKDELLKQVELFEDQIEIMKKAIKENDMHTLKERFISSKVKREGMNNA